MDTGRTTSFAQQRLWFLDQLTPGAPDYLLPLALRLRGTLDAAALEQALGAVVERHEVLRTRFVTVDGEPRQLIDDHVDVPFGRIEHTDEPDLTAVIERELQQPIDIAAAPPLRATLVRLGPDDHLLVLVVHHIAIDGWSWSVLIADLAAAYRGERLPPLPVQYAEFAEWQAQRLTGPRMAAQLDHWHTSLTGLTPLALPTDRPRPATWDGSGASVRFDIPADVVARVDTLARSRRSTRFMVVLAAYHALLAHYTGRSDIAVGTPLAGRSRADVEGLIGLFVNTVVLRADLGGSPSFTEVLRRVRDVALAGFTHAETPFEQVVNELTVERDMSRNPLCQASFSLLNTAQQPISMPGLDVTLVNPPLAGSPVDVFMDLSLCPDGRLAGCLQYSTALFDHASMQQFTDGYRTLLQAVLDAPDEPVATVAAAIAALPGRERARLLAIGNDTTTAVPELTVAQLFERQATATPDAPAVSCGDVTLTYARLDARTNQLAHHLRASGVGPGTLVGVRLDRGIDLLVTFLAVLRTGAAYVPIDPDHPARRIEYVLADSGATLVVTDALLADPAIALQPEHRPIGTDRADGLAYIIYTSGSTGLPKGVMIEHRGLTNFVASIVGRTGLRAGQTVIAHTTVSFDPSVLELYAPLIVGGHVQIASAEEAKDPLRMAALIARVAPAILQATPVWLRMLLDFGWNAPAGLAVLSGGEKLPAELARRLAAGGATVWDIYGPTETTVWATTARLDARAGVIDWAAEDNSSVHLLDAWLEPVPIGAEGEIYLGGTGVARGYRNRPGTTAEAFLPDPHGSRPGARLYRTGDLGRRHPDGHVQILGRRDHQVKIRGHRIELGEIEAVLLGHPDVRAAVVHPLGDQLAAYVVGAAAGAALRAYLLATLPDHMVPGTFVPLAALPLTPSGKVDRTALPAPDISAADATPRVSPRTPTEATVARVWEEVLPGRRVGAHDDFFEIGGHSLLATRVAVRLRSALGIDVPVRSLFDHTTVAALAAALPGYPRVADNQAVPTLAARRRNRATVGAAAGEDAR